MSAPTALLDVLLDIFDANSKAAVLARDRDDRRCWAFLVLVNNFRNLDISLLGDKDDAIITFAQSVHYVLDFLPVWWPMKTSKPTDLKPRTLPLVADNCNLFTHMYPSAFP